MAGRAPITEMENGVIERCYLLNAEDQWEPATNPLNRYSTIRKDIKMQKLSPGYGFAKRMLDNDRETTLGLVVNAKGGTKIEQWEKGTEFYNEAIRRTRITMQSGILKGVLWHQGEGNSSNPEGYFDKLKKLIADLRDDLGMADLPFVAGQVFYDPGNKPHTRQINDILAQLPYAMSSTGCVRSNGLTTFDNTHFDTNGMLLLGQRYAEVMLDIQMKHTEVMNQNPLLRALQLDKAGDWEAAHNIVQDIHTSDGSWLHAYLHRKEGDLGNAAYWYSRAGKPVADDSLEEEWDRLHAAFQAGD